MQCNECVYLIGEFCVAPTFQEDWQQLAERGECPGFSGGEDDLVGAVKE